MRSDGNLDVVVLLGRRSEGGMNSFVTEDAIWHQGKGCAGRPSVTEETIGRVRETFTRSPMKSVRRASRELKIPEPTVRKILQKRLQLYPYKLQLVQNPPIIYTHPYLPLGLTFRNFTFSPCNAFMCVVWISEPTPTIYVYNIIYWPLNEEESCLLRGIN